jgi:hypothetical protein
VSLTTDIITSTIETSTPHRRRGRPRKNEVKTIDKTSIPTSDDLPFKQLTSPPRITRSRLNRKEKEVADRKSMDGFMRRERVRMTMQEVLRTPRSNRVSVKIALLAIKEIDGPLHDFILANTVWDATTREKEERLIAEVVERLNHDDEFCESVVTLVCDAREMPLLVRDNITQSASQVPSTTVSVIPDKEIVAQEVFVQRREFKTLTDSEIEEIEQEQAQNNSQSEELTAGLNEDTANTHAQLTVVGDTNIANIHAQSTIATSDAQPLVQIQITDATTDINEKLPTMPNSNTNVDTSSTLSPSEVASDIPIVASVRTTSTTSSETHKNGFISDSTERNDPDINEHSYNNVTVVQSQLIMARNTPVNLRPVHETLATRNA